MEEVLTHVSSVVDGTETMQRYFDGYSKVWQWCDLDDRLKVNS